MDRSLAFSILKTAYGWNGATKTEAQQSELETITDQHDCERCAAAEMAALIHDTCGNEYFQQRLDGKPNTYSVERDRAGQQNHNLH